MASLKARLEKLEAAANTIPTDAFIFVFKYIDGQRVFQDSRGDEWISEDQLPEKSTMQVFMPIRDESK